MRTDTLLAFLSLACATSLAAQIQTRLPGCEANPEVRYRLEQEFDANALDKMKFQDRLARERQVLESLITQYPREFEPYRRLIEVLKEEAPDQLPSLRDRLVKMAKRNPDDPFALLLAGLALRGTDTPESIRLLESAKSKAPTFPWPAMELAGEYFRGKYADVNKLKQNLELFFSLCPGSADSYAQLFLAKDPELQPRVAAGLRARLERETDPKRLEDYSILFGLEFRTHPPGEHAALRAQIARDLIRLEKFHPDGDAEWWAFLISGYKQSGASSETINAMQDRLIREYPHSNEASKIVQDRWDKANKEPEDQADILAWSKYRKDYEHAVKHWMVDYPENSSLQRYEWFYAIYNDDTISEQEGTAALNAYLQSVKDFDPPSVWMWRSAAAAEFLEQHQWQATRAAGLAKEASASHEKNLALEKEDDNLSDAQIKDRNEQEAWDSQYLNGLMLRAAKQAEGLQNEAPGMKASIEAPPPSDKKFQSGYWLNRARLEALQNHWQDALVYYQLALQTRLEPPKWSRGKFQDDLTDEARTLWKAQGGSDAAWALWSKPLSGGADQAEGGWEKAPKPILAFELSDLSGKTWRLKELAGRKLLINVWATWCGPCQAEMPHLQKFYESIRDRSDLQLLTFNIDEELGLVGPYMKEKGYTFPVLPAFSTVVSLLDGLAIPQNWIVDDKGAWLWRQIGFRDENEAEFENEILEHLQSANNAP